MANERARADMADVMAELRWHMREMERIRRERAHIVGRGVVRRNRVTVLVDADGTVVKTMFGPDVADLSRQELARAVTEAAQLAAADAFDQMRILLAPIQTRRGQRLTQSDLIEGVPGLNELLSDLPSVPVLGDAEK